MKKQAIFGTPEQGIDELETYREALGDDIHVILRIYYPGIGTERVVEYRTPREEVVPQFE